MSMTLSDAALVSAHLSGDRGALASIYDRYASGLYDTAAAMLSDRHDAADMVQDVFCIAAERLGQLRDPDRLKPWLYAVLRNEVYRRTKRRRRATPTDFQSNTVPDVVAPSDPNADGASVAFAELASLVRAAAAGLDERDQLVLELSIRQGLDGSDLADALGVTPEQSYSLVHRMRERVDRSLGALVVAKAGRRECATLDEILRDWNGEFSVLIRKRVARHIDSCRVCEATKGKVAPLALFGAAPVFAAPLGLRERVLEAASKIVTPGAGGGSTGGSAPRIRLRSTDGFPRAARLVGRGLGWISGAVALTVAGSVLVLTNSDSSSPNVGASISVVEDSPSPSPGTVGASVPDTEPRTTTTESTQSTTSSSASEGSTITTDVPIPTAPTIPLVTSIAPPSLAGPVETPTSPPSPTTILRTTTTTTTTKPAPLVALGVDTSSIDFSNTGTTAKFRLTNPNSRDVSWAITADAPTFFTFSPSSGNLAAGTSVSIAVTFARTAASSYTNTSSFAEGRFTKSARVTATGVSSTSLNLQGSVGRPPQVGSIAVGFSGSGCANASIKVSVSDESPLKSVVATLAANDSSAMATRTVNLSDSGKGSWGGASANLPKTVTALVVTVTATDVNGLATTVNTKINRLTSC